ncbi:hypothetical protein RF11_01869 [Thelohanellus kitauei]|uniref:Uncharacterized protein n=1 Tax=Thelohanellus kitauei TaxID=669202 RepID=A0A0C2MFJ1_THEKT|nr:hypothetical protein RF11_01869 [Thelohanellus kitauei]
MAENSIQMHQEITETLKRHYYKLLLCGRLEAIDELKVRMSTIRNFFSKLKFIKENIKIMAQNAELIELYDFIQADRRYVTGAAQSQISCKREAGYTVWGKHAICFKTIYTSLPKEDALAHDSLERMTDKYYEKIELIY